MQTNPCYSILSIQPTFVVMNKNQTPKKTQTQNQTQYDLKQNMFDPTKSSPPNDFMEKLKMRMSVYESFSKNSAILTNE
jgi:hypothetical protein